MIAAKPGNLAKTPRGWRRILGCYFLTLKINRVKILLAFLSGGNRGKDSVNYKNGQSDYGPYCPAVF